MEVRLTWPDSIGGTTTVRFTLRYSEVCYVKAYLHFQLYVLILYYEVIQLSLDLLSKPCPLLQTNKHKQNTSWRLKTDTSYDFTDTHVLLVPRPVTLFSNLSKLLFGHVDPETFAHDNEHVFFCFPGNLFETSAKTKSLVTAIQMHVASSGCICWLQIIGEYNHDLI